MIKNFILFYKLIGENIFSFFYKKVAILFLESLLFIILGITVISLIFSNFSHYILLIVLFSLVVLHYILIIGTISVLSPNILISIGFSIIYWIGSIILVAVNKSVFGLLAPFEASNSMYATIESVLSNQTNFINAEDIVTIIIFFVLILLVNFIVLLFAKKRWLKLGM